MLLVPLHGPSEAEASVCDFLHRGDTGEISPSRSSILHVFNDYWSLFPQSEEGWIVRSET